MHIPPNLEAFYELLDAAQDRADDHYKLMKATLETLNEHLGAGYDITPDDYLHRLIASVLDTVEEI